jgi:membrane protein implicated in regulation of membrane protease activity
MTNEGTIDRAIRIVLGLGLLALVFVGPQTALGWIGVVPLATGIIGFCPLYKIVGLSTCPVQKRA